MSDRRPRDRARQRHGYLIHQSDVGGGARLGSGLSLAKSARMSGRELLQGARTCSQLTTDDS